jgi:hypothetical protein
MLDLPATDLRAVRATAEARFDSVHEKTSLIVAANCNTEP